MQKILQRAAIHRYVNMAPLSDIELGTFEVS
jgi:hypothetical protein